jgi:hypothetical protein
MLAYLFFSTRRGYSMRQRQDLSSYQLELIADPYSDHMFFKKNDSETKKEMSKM